VSLGNTQSAATSQVAAANKKDGFLAAIRGYEDYYANKAVTKGGLQQLQFVWGVSVCPVPTPIVEQPEPLETPAEEPAPEPVPEPETEFCPPDLDKCNTTATAGSTFCPAAAPFVTNQCVGGCCVSAGKCRKGFCAQAGLGAEVMAADMLCWGTNTHPLNKFNKCRNLACKLAVPGCVSDLLSGSCVGSVVALSNDLDNGAKQWVGYPCLQTVPGGLPVDALGKVDLNGAYAAKL